ncbi:hypothetical protein BJY00DRAFT_310755 [Aspergillus carlsbadensis]|nr:hypothetical protein BJY00DRAFT_310755 [Aspergillus carlsbadensis]
MSETQSLKQISVLRSAQTVVVLLSIMRMGRIVEEPQAAQKNTSCSRERTTPSRSSSSSLAETAQSWEPWKTQCWNPGWITVRDDTTGQERQGHCGDFHLVSSACDWPAAAGSVCDPHSEAGRVGLAVLRRDRLALIFPRSVSHLHPMTKIIPFSSEFMMSALAARSRAEPILLDPPEGFFCNIPFELKDSGSPA